MHYKLSIDQKIQIADEIFQFYKESYHINEKNFNPKINDATLSARKIDELFDSVYLRLVEIDKKNLVTEHFAPKWKTLKETWREVLQESRYQAANLANYMDRFADVILPLLQNADLPMQNKLEYLESCIRTVKSHQRNAEKVRNKFDNLCEDVATCLAGYDKYFGKEEEDEFSDQIKELEGKAVSTRNSLGKAFMKWGSALVYFGLGKIAKLFSWLPIPERFTFKSLPNDSKELKEATAHLYNIIKNYYSNWIDRKKIKGEIAELRSKVQIIEQARIDLFSTIEEAKELAEMMKLFSDIWCTFSCEIRNIKTRLEETKERPVFNNDFAWQLLCKEFKFIGSMLRTTGHDLRLYTQNVTYNDK